ncbi:hypothetical protein [Halomonas caseinilytica]|uniref:hypothetical protein n=1 Tax=Halomonas caseinilytica TaxID=438744 RepID=UPI0007E5502B|nr:hypothetical protein [Halomonas caseinilytica]
MAKSYAHLKKATEGQWILFMQESGLSLDAIKQAVKEQGVAGENADAVVEYVLGHIDDEELERRTS